MRWEKVQVNPISGVAEAGSVVSPPGRRWGHTCNAIKGGRLVYLFGGYGKDNCQTNQVHVFDTGGFTLHSASVVIPLFTLQSSVNNFYNLIFCVEFEAPSFGFVVLFALSSGKKFEIFQYPGWWVVPDFCHLCVSIYTVLMILNF